MYTGPNGLFIIVPVLFRAAPVASMWAPRRALVVPCAAPAVLAEVEGALWKASSRALLWALAGMEGVLASFASDSVSSFCPVFSFAWLE